MCVKLICYFTVCCVLIQVNFPHPEKNYLVINAFPTVKIADKTCPVAYRVDDFNCIPPVNSCWDWSFNSIFLRLAFIDLPVIVQMNWEFDFTGKLVVELMSV